MDLQLGWHWIFDAELAQGEPLRDEAQLRRALTEIPPLLGLRAVAPAQVYSHQEGAERSVAGIILLAESHLSLHAFPDRLALHGDLFSCKPFDPRAARERLVALFGPMRLSERTLDRLALPEADRKTA